MYPAYYRRKIDDELFVLVDKDQGIYHNLKMIKDYLNHLHVDYYSNSFSNPSFEYPCVGCGREQMHKYCPAHGTPFYMSSVIFTPKIEKASIMARNYHIGQKRWNGDDYFDAHITKVVKYLMHYNIANLLRSYMFDDWEDLYCAAYLHDTLEDTALKPEIIEKEFGSNVLSLVLDLTKTKDEGYFEFIMRIKDAFQYRRSYLVKIADLCANMEDADEKEKKSSRYAKYEFARYVLSHKN